MNSTTPYGVALRRGLISAALTAAVAACGLLLTDATFREIVAIAGSAGLTPLALRFGFEGTVDTRKAGGNGSGVSPGD